MFVEVKIHLVSGSSVAMQAQENAARTPATIILTMIQLR